MEQAILGGGCFWCLEPVFRALRGVSDVRPGFCGGHVDHPSYEQVCRQGTGHVEVVQLDFDPRQLSYETLLQVFFGTHDPTTPDRQGHDVGPQYASVIFYLNDAQRQMAEQVRAAAQAHFDAPICTRIEAAGPFWPAEALHQDYYRRNPQQGYCQFVISPKMAKFRRHYAQLLRPDA
ncbi:peptide-methionine (S)-S-oxide reductase MsrA [Castellaniella caeni]|uniref:peptide-methionine (S)-S-oxide reductase MsrA n=1 Tax=Castellaniella caeni TaxID=266123 RepID=UPI0015E136DE|nr:peptide-methionine (S)-S-oxide reductase MsrA [Castellaniella caeni]